ncbi:hypothetical protein TRFO_31536 [Tritrichomonas foetus]|uniref:CAMK family protein kinase n=1 Tax=Tritrichomonas foetus TaxID=1144522 RepID=A0A1J4JR19_9EUKA|nr:hypothetical protein TRFO_31536 [Tritrichomonas foetus]|eukprot:OHT01561.1 hypothetical protein TRFO_31536 [Tritrichomonas foetus]
MKIQRGTFSMPEFNPAIKDILKKMLTVDPTKRITIPQIKEHQCFRWKIQEDYLLPRPLPAEYNDEDLSPEVLNAIDKVCSLSHDQFISELKSATNNLPKVIVAMLSSHLDLENLPWEKESNFSNIPKQLHDISIMFSNTNPNLSETTKLQNPQIDNDNFMKNETNELNHDFNVLNNGLNDQDPFHRHVITPMSPELKLNSKVSKPMWDFVDQLITEPIHETEVILNMKPNELANVMRVIQLAMNEMEQIMWFHPDPTRFYIRGKDNNSCFFSEIEAICEIDHMKIDFRLKKGDCDPFSVFCAKMCAELEIFYNQANTPKINE